MREKLEFHLSEAENGWSVIPDATGDRRHWVFSSIEELAAWLNEMTAEPQPEDKRALNANEIYP